MRRIAWPRLTFAGVATGIVLAGLAKEMLFSPDRKPERLYALIAALATVIAWLRDEAKNARNGKRQP